MRLCAGIWEATTGAVGPGRWVTLRMSASHSSLLDGGDVSLFTLEAWKRWISPERAAAEPRRDLLYRSSVPVDRECNSAIVREF